MLYNVEEMNEILTNNEKLWEKIKVLNYIGSEKRTDNLFNITMLKPIKGLDLVKNYLGQFETTQKFYHCWETLSLPDYDEYMDDPEDQPYMVRFYYVSSSEDDFSVPPLDAKIIVIDLIRGADYILSSGLNDSIFAIK